MTVEIRELGATRTAALGQVIKKRLAAILDNSFLDDALPEYCLVLLANRHEACKVRDELGSFLGVKEAEGFTEWLFGAYQQARERHIVDKQPSSSAAASMASSEEPHQQRRTVVRTHRMFQTALRDATGLEKQRRMQVERGLSPSPAKNGSNERARRDRDYLDRDLELFMAERSSAEHVSATLPAAAEGTAKCPTLGCRSPSCALFHPSEPCKYFPTCTNGDRCLYVHPAVPCRFQDRCINPNCNFRHESAPSPQLAAVPAVAAQYKSAAQSTILCRFHPRCTQPQCPFMHPSHIPCRFGEACTRPDCIYTHPTGATRHVPKSIVNAPCRFGRQCVRVNCPFQHAPIAQATAATVAMGVVAALSLPKTADVEAADCSGATGDVEMGGGQA